MGNEQPSSRKPNTNQNPYPQSQYNRGNKNQNNTKAEVEWLRVWKCERCTFDNKMKDEICQMCYQGDRGPSLEQVSGLEKEKTEIEADEVKIVLTTDKWNESLKAMRNLKHFSEKERKKEKEKKEKIGNDVLDSIDVLFNNIFRGSSESSVTNSKSNKKRMEEEKQAIEEGEQKDQVNLIKMKKTDDESINEHKEILTQLHDDHEKNKQDETINKFNRQKIENENKNKNKQKNTALKKQFCEKFDGFGLRNKRYQIKSLSSIENGYDTLIFEDFLSINRELIDGQLKNLLLEHSNNNQDIDFLYNKIIRTRNICSIFPFKHPFAKWSKYNSDYISLIERLNRKTNDKIKLFCILYNCMVNVFVPSDEHGGLDRYIFHCKDDDNDLNSVCEWYILVEMVKTGIFGNDKKLMNHETSRIYGEDVYSSSSVSCIVSNIFDNDLTSFKKLLKYCGKDIKENNDIEKLKKIYENNTNYYLCDYGIQFYVLNRLTYYVYHDLLLLFDISNKNDNLLLFPKLKKLFAFLYDFAIYFHCYPDAAKKECLLFLCFIYFYCLIVVGC